MIDLTRIGTADAARAALIVLEGMGRAVDKFARALRAALNLGMVKHPEVAQCLRGTLYGVCRFRRPEE